MSTSISSFSDSTRESPCDCKLCRYGQDCKFVDPYPFYPTMCRPMVYVAQVSQDKEAKHDKKRNLFLRAFQWYTEEHHPHTPQNNTATTSTGEVNKETPKGKDEVSAFANWLDTKYEQFLLQRPENANVCCQRRVETPTSIFCERVSRPDNRNICCDRHVETPTSIVCEHVSIEQGDTNPSSSAKKRFSRFTRVQSKSADRACRRDCQTNALEGARTNSMEYILAPKNISRMASECCHPTPISSPSMNKEVKCKTDDKIKPVKIDKPPSEQKAEVVKPLVQENSYVIKPSAEQKLGDSVKPSVEQKLDDGAKPLVEKKHKVPKEPNLVAHSHKNHKEKKQSAVICQCEIHPPNNNAKMQYKPHSATPSLTHENKDKEPPKPNEEKKAIKSDASSQYENELREVQIQYQEQPQNVCCSRTASQSQANTDDSTSVKFAKPNVEDKQSIKEEVQPNTEQELQQPINPKICPSFQKPCPSFSKTASELATPCPSLQQPCPGRRPCPTHHGPCFLNTPTTNEDVLQQHPQLKLRDIHESSSKPKPPVNQYICPTFQEPCPSFFKPISELAAPCPSLQQPCPAQRTCPTLHGPCFLNTPKTNEDVLQQHPQLNLRDINESSSKPEPPVNQNICPSFQEPCPSFFKPISELAAPCPSLQQPCPAQRTCPTLYGPCFLNTPKINETVLQQQPQLNQMLKSETPVNQNNVCPTFNEPCPSFYKSSSRVVTPCPSVQQPYPDRGHCPTLHGPIDPRVLYYETNCICRRSIPTRQDIRREMCLQCYCNQCPNTCLTYANIRNACELPQMMSQNVSRPPIVRQNTIVGQCTVDHSCLQTKTEYVSVISESVSTKPSCVTLACQTSDHAIRLDKETIGSNYPFFMKIVCADRLKQ